MTNLAHPLQPAGPTHVILGRRKLIYFGGCDYFRMSQHPRVRQALRKSLDRDGLNVAASRKTTGNHAIYEELEARLAAFFRAPAAMLAPNGYVTNLIVAQALQGRFTHALIDERAHGSLQDAALLLGCPMRRFSRHDSGAIRRALQKCGAKAKVLLLTDGTFSHDGSVAPLGEYLKLLPRTGMLWVDDAHGVGTLGPQGRGAMELCGVRFDRTILTMTLSKAFGVYGGAILGAAGLKAEIIARSRMFIGSTPIPLPFAAAAMTSLSIVMRDHSRRKRLEANKQRVATGLNDVGFAIPDSSGPIVAVIPRSPKNGEQIRKALLRAGIHPPLIQYSDWPKVEYFRFAISSEHTPAQLDLLIRVLTQFAG